MSVRYAGPGGLDPRKNIIKQPTTSLSALPSSLPPVLPQPDVYQVNIPISLGDNIMLKACLDSIKHKFTQIKLTHHKYYIETLVSDQYNKDKYYQFLKELGTLLFSESPYVFDQGVYPFRDQECVLTDLNITPVKPNLAHLLCKGQLLNIGEYIVITTKVRYFPRASFDLIAPEFWDIIGSLSARYKIVILGERVVESRGEYLTHGLWQIYSFYQDIINNVSSDRIVDLTIPVACVTAPDLAHIQQDCQTMHNAKFVITFGVGGNFCMAMATSNIVGYRTDNVWIANKIFSNSYLDAFVTKDWVQFTKKLKNYA